MGAAECGKSGVCCAVKAACFWLPRWRPSNRSGREWRLAGSFGPRPAPRTGICSENGAGGSGSPSTVL